MIRPEGPDRETPADPPGEPAPPEPDLTGPGAAVPPAAVPPAAVPPPGEGPPVGPSVEPAEDMSGTLAARRGGGRAPHDPARRGPGGAAPPGPSPPGPVPPPVEVPPVGPSVEPAEDMSGTLAALTADDLDQSERRRLLGRLAGQIRARGIGDLFRPRAAMRWIADAVGDIAPRLPIRDGETLRRHHPGLTPDAVVERLIRNAGRTTAAVGAASGGGAAVRVGAPPRPLSRPRPPPGGDAGRRAGAGHRHRGGPPPR